jgi:catechol-2,3-dioxygenase
LATHTAWGVESPEELTQWKETLERRGITVSPYTRHEILESIYFRDPNGYPIEVTLRLRDVHVLDAKDAEMTLAAAIALEDELAAKQTRVQDIDTVWRRKAKLVEDYIGTA